MRQYLIEGVTGAFPFIVDRSKAPVTESRPNGSSYTRIPGRFSVCDCVNGNNRRYRKRVWEKNLQPGSPLQESISRNAAFGLLEHPKDGLVTLQSPISHQVIKAEMVESKDANGNPVYEVVGEIALYNPNLVPESAKLLGLIEGGYNPMVSSRGYGSLSKGPDGVDEVDEDYVCESWDVVIKPSFETAELTPDRSSTKAQMAEPYRPNPQAETLAPTKAAPPTTAANPIITLKESSPSTGSASPASDPKTETKTMELTEIKNRINGLRTIDPAKPRRFAESMSEVESLHQNIAEWAATDPKRSWSAQKLHAELDDVAKGFTESMQLPAKEAKRLSEQNRKLMSVVEAVAKTAVTYKKKLGENLKNGAQRTKVMEELTRRGQGWQRIAESRKQKFITLEQDFNTACEALDIMAQRYHEDMTELGRRLIVLEFKERAQTPEIQKQLKEATRLRHIVAVRESLEGKKTGTPVTEEGKGGDPGGKQPKEGEQPSQEAVKDDKQKGAPSPKEGCVAKEPGSVTHESKDQGKKEGAQPVAEAKVLKTERTDMSVRNVNESVELVRRLSGAAPAAK